MAKMFVTACAIACVLVVAANCEAARSTEVQASSISANMGGRRLQGGPSPTGSCFTPDYSVYNRLDCRFGTDQSLCFTGNVDITYDDYSICCQASFGSQPDEYWGCPFPKGTIPESCFYIEWGNTPPSCEPTNDPAKCGAQFSYSSLDFCKAVLRTKGINSP